MDCEHLEKLFHAELLRVEQTLDARLDASDLAFKLYRDQLDKEIGHLNQVRSEVLQDRNSLVSKEYFRIEMEKIQQYTRSAWITIIGWVIAVSALAIMLLKN